MAILGVEYSQTDSKWAFAHQNLDAPLELLSSLPRPPPVQHKAQPLRLQPARQGGHLPLLLEGASAQQSWNVGAKKK